MRARFAVLLASLLCGAAGPALSQGTVYRCPGNPVLYTDQITAAEARDRGCRTIDGAPVTVVQTHRPRPATASTTAPPASGTPAAPAAGTGAGTRVDPAAQRARDADKRRILGEELKREEDRLEGMRREFNNGEPERRGDERNFQRYLDRVAEMRAAIQRTEADIAALKREIAKLPPGP
jgi:hypothetical protein